MGKLTQNKIIKFVAACLIAALAFSGNAYAQGDEAAQANNPLANFTAFNIQNYYIPTLTDSDADANQTWLRFAQPFATENFGNWLFRASLPINSFPTMGGSNTTGLGDLNMFAAYTFDTGNPAVALGAGPLLSIPTASDSALGSGKWEAGAAAVYFNANSPKFQYGGLVTWQTDFAGDDSRADRNFMAVQPFAFLQLGEGYYLRSAPIWAFNLENGNYAMPIGLGFGKVIPREKVVYNIFIEPQYTVIHEGAGFPEFQIYGALNLQFKR